MLYHALPKKTLLTKDEKCTRDKHKKIRLTGLVAANMNSDGLPVFVTDKLDNLLCIKQVKKLLCRCRAPKKS